MNFTEYRSSVNGQFVEVGGSAGAKNQCVDLANDYISKVFGQPMVFGTNAIDFPARIGSKWEYILNSPTGVPSPGDLVIWKPSPGHIAVFIEGNANRFTSFDQNFPVGSKCHVQEHTYQNVVGWLHFKGGAMAANMYPTVSPNIDLNNVASVKAAIDTWVRVVKGELVEKTELSKQLADLQSKLNTEKGQALDAQERDLRTKLATVLQVGAGEELSDLLDMVKELKDHPPATSQPVGSDPKEEITVNGAKWKLNGLILVDGKYQANYMRV